MADISTITAFLGSIKTATDIAKAIREAGVSLEKAEAKLKMADLMESLAEARIQAAEIQEVIQEKDKRIAELAKAFELKSKLIRYGDAYYDVDQSGNPIGDPYCSNCWEVNHKTVHVNYDVLGRNRLCPACKTSYNRRRARTIGSPAETEDAT